MRAGKLLWTITPLFRMLFLRRRAPLFVSWNLTFDCNLSCGYCITRGMHASVQPTSEVLRGLEKLRTLGTRWITFGGGEPLLLRDIDKILARAKSLGMQVYLSTNGSLLPEKAGVLRWVDHVNLSLDGERRVHDALRGRGSFDDTLKAAQICRSADVGASLLCVLSAKNLDQPAKVLQMAAANGLCAMFQPIEGDALRSSDNAPLLPDPALYRAAIDSIIELKSRGAPVRNSFSGLKLLRAWPGAVSASCPAGRFVAVVEPDGSMVPCHLLCQREKASLYRNEYRDFKPPYNCGRCWCAPLVELGLISAWRPEALLNAVRIML